MEPEDLPRRPVRPGVLRGLLPQAEDRLCPILRHPRIPDGMEEELRTYLESFSHLSVRERQGQGIVRDITGKDVPVVLDPTLLLERTDWAAAARDGGAGRGYILCYCISRPDALAPYIRRLAEETGLPVVQLCGVRQKVHPKARCILSAGPAEFLGLFRDAAYVCTNSFHGTVFSVQFQSPSLRRWHRQRWLRRRVPDLQPVEPPGTGGADHRQGRYRGPDGAHRLGGGGERLGGSGSCPWTICAAP
ncbi:MAG: polysaccharide pyruvyl transferase family protein [Dysosmobacter welbionis]